MKEKYTLGNASKNNWNYAAAPVNKKSYTPQYGSGKKSADISLNRTEAEPLEQQVPNNSAAKKPVHHCDDLQICGGAAGDTNTEDAINLSKGAGEFGQPSDWRLIRQMRHIQQSLEAKTQARLQAWEEKTAKWEDIASRLLNTENRLAQQEQQLIQRLENLELKLANNQEINNRWQLFEQELILLSNMISQVEVRLRKGEEGFNAREDKLREEVSLNIEQQMDDIKTVQHEMGSRLDQQSADRKKEYNNINERLQAAENKISILDEWTARFESSSRKSNLEEMDNYQTIVTRLKHMEDFCNYLLALVQTDNSGRSFDFSKGLVFKV
ncbi:Uncharacterized [Syntrophomonas zehnderi OL-4]|uniref:Uncharacterized n=1 Tax=Syntrophomonas zehnderi OL-4 TaxID=690567 RepID=A0A0E4GBN0_9FIRM|nr:hypothetical protein [Syntrophomonas zehnderi]CFX51327.1 Uncharacterized [Syntrophomonas zehnderi OL-4]